MRILYGNGFSDADRHEKVASIQHNALTFIKTLCTQAAEMEGGGEFGDHKVEAEAIMAASETDPISEELGATIAKLWGECAAIKLAWERRSDFQIIESNVEYMEKIQEIR